MEPGEDRKGKRPLERGDTPAKRHRKNLRQVEELERAYSEEKSPTAEIKENLARTTGLNFKQVQAWFGNRRSYDRYGPRRKKHSIDGDGGLLRSPAISRSGDGSSQPAPPWAPPRMQPPTVPVQQVLAPSAPESQQLQHPVASPTSEALPGIPGQTGQSSQPYEENVNLIEDEKLELMELAASNLGFPSIYSLDGKSRQQLDLFEDMLGEFPPQSVQLKRPFAVKPWIDSEENVTNLLMVWKFLTTFADLLELHQFTLDELVQSLHDHDSRLLGEIHVALLKYIVKEIENVANARPSSSGDIYQRIVRGALAWELDIHCWQRHLNFMTWPEILRQLGLSAGLGPKLKKCSADTSYSSNTNENDGELVENAGALTQQRHVVEIDKNDLGELWIAQLTLGEYSVLDAEERLKALAAIIDLSIAGSSLRIILEERLEAANALKDNMWSEVMGTEEENKNKHSHFRSYIHQKAEGIYEYRALPLGQDRRHNRYWQFSTSPSLTDPGLGRIFFESKNGLWRVLDSEEAFDALLAVLNTRGVRESYLCENLREIEATFRQAIRRSRGPTNFVLQHDPPIKIEMVQNEKEKCSVWNRYKDFLRWLWKNSFNSNILCAMQHGKTRCLLATCDFCYEPYLPEERHCSSCHKTFITSDNTFLGFQEHLDQCKEKQNEDFNSFLPIRIQLLKAQLMMIEVSIPTEALQTFWTEDYKKSWCLKLHSSSAAKELLQILAQLESAIKREYLSPSYRTTYELLELSPKFLANSASIPVLDWLADSTAAVTLRIQEFDSSITYTVHQKPKSIEEKEATGYNGSSSPLPSSFPFSLRGC